MRLSTFSIPLRRDPEQYTCTLPVTAAVQNILDRPRRDTLRLRHRGTGEGEASLLLFPLSCKPPPSASPILLCAVVAADATALATITDLAALTALSAIAVHAGFTAWAVYSVIGDNGRTYYRSHASLAASGFVGPKSNATFPESPRMPFQEDWDLCHQGKKHYH